MAKLRRAPDGLDYVPVPGANEDLVFGVLRRTLAGKKNCLDSAIARRLYPISRPELTSPWPPPTCLRSEVLLPDWAPADYLDPEKLCSAYASQLWEETKDWIVMINLRFPGTVSLPPTITLHGAYEKARGFALERLVRERQLPCVLSMHAPLRSGKQKLVPHVHVMALARELGPAGFGGFATDLTTDRGRKVIDEEWAAYCDER